VLGSCFFVAQVLGSLPVLGAHKPIELKQTEFGAVIAHHSRWICLVPDEILAATMAAAMIVYNDRRRFLNLPR
jgi:hypothetical protein